MSNLIEGETKLDNWGNVSALAKLACCCWRAGPLAAVEVEVLRRRPLSRSSALLPSDEPPPRTIDGRREAAAAVGLPRVDAKHNITLELISISLATSSLLRVPGIRQAQNFITTQRRRRREKLVCLPPSERCVEARERVARSRPTPVCSLGRSFASSFAGNNN